MNIWVEKVNKIAFLTMRAALVIEAALTLQALEAGKQIAFFHGISGESVNEIPQVSDQRRFAPGGISGQ